MERNKSHFSKLLCLLGFISRLAGCWPQLFGDKASILMNKKKKEPVQDVATGRMTPVSDAHYPLNHGHRRGAPHRFGTSNEV
jgi:hypothetical protein